MTKLLGPLGLLHFLRHWFRRRYKKKNENWHGVGGHFSKYTVANDKLYLQDQGKSKDKMATATKSKKSSRKSSKRTNEKYRNTLRSARDGLVKEMNLDVLLHMKFGEVFSKTEKEDIKDDCLTREQQCEKFLDLLECKGAKAFKRFVETIDEVQPHLAYLLTDIKEGKSRVILICFIYRAIKKSRQGAISLSLVCWSPDLAVRVLALAGHYMAFLGPHSASDLVTQLYKWKPNNLMFE